MKISLHSSFPSSSLLYPVKSDRKIREQRQKCVICERHKFTKVGRESKNGNVGESGSTGALDIRFLFASISSSGGGGGGGERNGIKMGYPPITNSRILFIFHPVCAWPVA